MDIAIIGGGITGLASAFLLSKSGHNVVIYSDKLGGDYLKGGLKYIHYTEHVKNLLDMLGIDYGIRKINGAVLTNNADVKGFPEYLYYSNNNLYTSFLQHSYWVKTRGEKDFDSRCMNEPWNYRVELATTFGDYDINPEIVVESLVDYTQNLTFRKGYVRASDILSLIDDKEFDKIIYTIPLGILLQSFYTKYDIYFDVFYDNQKLYIDRFECTEDYNLNKVWWDYLYLPGDELFCYHRISKHKLGFDAEYNGKNKLNDLMAMDLMRVTFRNFMENEYGINKEAITFNKKNNISLKGHIKKDFDVKKINKMLDNNNILLLGRFAEWDKRITFDKVLEKLYNYIVRL